jgi:uracil phosphoribosyltransferase
MHFTLNENNSIANDFLRELRDKTLQRDRMRFRKNVERLGEIMAYEVSKALRYEDGIVETPLGSSRVAVLKEQPVLITVMRAGLPFFQGFLNLFDKADCGFIGAYRKEGDGNLTIKLDYVASTVVNNKILILVDPMLATGRSLVDSLKTILMFGAPREIHIVSLIAAPEGLKFLKEQLTVPFHTWTCAVDEKLDENFFIVPGLGDAGDLSFGVKI